MKRHPDLMLLLKRLLLTLAAVAAVQLVVFSFDFMLAEHRRENQAMATRITSEQVVLRIEAGVQERMNALGNLARHGSRENLALDFEDGAAIILRRFPDFQAVNWVEPSGRILQTCPASGNEGALGRNLLRHPDPSVPRAFRATLAEGGIHRSSVVNLLQGGRGFACYLAVHDEHGQSLGVINGVFRVERLIDACLPEESLRRKYNISLVTDQHEVIYECNRDRALPVGVTPVQLPLTIVEPGWSFQMTPTRAHLAALAGPFEDMLPWLGHLFSLLIATLTWYLLRWRQESRSGEARYRELFRRSLDGVFITDSQNRLLDVNPAALAIFGYERAEVLYQPVSRLGNNREQLLKLQNQLLRDGAISRQELVFRDREGREKRCLLSAVGRLSDGGRLDGVMGIISDVTEHYLTREQLRQAQKMEAIGQLAGGVAHDFNNLLTVISGNAELAMMQLGDDNPARVELKEIRTTAGRAANLTRQLLAFSRKQVIRPRLINANDTLHDMERMLRRIIGETIELGCELAPAAWTVKVDPAQLEQVIVNLVINARDAMDLQGRLQVRTRNQGVTDEGPGHDVPAGDYLIIEVSDSGCGMPPDVVEHIFEPFYTTKPEGVGTGLGLATVYGIVRQSEGHIQVESRVGTGTTFRIFLPRQAEQALDPVEVMKREILRGTETLLVVEDEPAVRRMTVDSLKRQGYEVHEAGNGRMALELALQLGGRIDLVVSDVVMPEMGGVEFVTELRQHMPRLPVLFLSGYSEEAIRRQGELQSDARLLQKPFDLHELHAQVRELLSNAVPAAASASRASS